MPQRAATALALFAATTALPACGLSQRDTGKFASLPASCEEALSAPAVQAALRQAFAPFAGAYTVTRRSMLLHDPTASGQAAKPEAVDLDHTQLTDTMTCLAEGKNDSRTSAGGQPQNRTVEVHFDRSSTNGLLRKDSAKQAHELIEPTQALDPISSAQNEPGIGEEARSWWTRSTALGSDRHIKFRISNVLVEVQAWGENHPANPSSTDGGKDSPDLRSELETTTQTVAKSIAHWLQNEWKK
ncbi:hypothetical protein Srot_2925 [Segniliparus rotundus DSM 44985]|uniref:Lipoprotein n=2 Tax=Segniliparus rotundus TaxID=286802 RepID=D6ZDU7_SEGRD|nr:hypothetical protein Srot_2925 [Segniliparus rotundus DSM 44985]